MKTKQEYIDALERMKESYYNFDNCISAMNKFKEDINLLTGLVNEHFEEKEESNFEHYKDEILDNCFDSLAVVKGIPKLCYKTSCNNCDFKLIQKGCHEKVMDWLKQPYKKPVYKLTKFEIDLLQSCSQGYSPKYQFKNINSLTEMKKNGYFKGVNRDATIEEIIAKSEVVG
nr:MAG TPA: hypothetical protein [Caudoviricetes sp.]